jgi:hypothetical protein
MQETVAHQQVMPYLSGVAATKQKVVNRFFNLRAKWTGAVVFGMVPKKPITCPASV